MPERVSPTLRRVRGRVVKAVRTSTSAESGSSGAGAPAPRPVRTCIGCRDCTAAAELLRVVVARDSAGQSVEVVPDPRRCLPGRGAWVHPEPGCVALAERRRAFGRALRVSGPLDPTPVREYVAERSGNHTSGRPQEMKINERAMKRQR